MIDGAIDSYYKYIKNNVLSLNPSRKCLGFMDAQDWPNEQIVLEALYLLIVGPGTPIGKQGYSPSSPILTYVLQWVWAIVGSDLQGNVKGRNRGERVRTDMAIREELRQAHIPGFTEKKFITEDLSVDPPVVKFNSYSPPDYIRWTPVEYKKNSDKDSGVIYGSASVNLTSITDTITAFG